jgi:hypothetical protein
MKTKGQPDMSRIHEFAANGAKKNGEHPMSARALGMRLKERGFVQERIGHNKARTWRIQEDSLVQPHGPDICIYRPQGKQIQNREDIEVAFIRPHPSAPESSHLTLCAFSAFVVRIPFDRHCITSS